MPVTIPKRPRPLGEKEMPLVAPTPAPHIDADPMDSGRHVVADAMPAGRHVEADPFGVNNGGQPPAEEAPVNFRGDPISAEQASTAHEGVEHDPWGQALVDVGAGAGWDALKGAARGLLARGGKAAAEKMAEKVVTQRVGAEGLTGLRAAKDAARDGKISTDELAQYARKLMGKGENEVVRRPEWEKRAYGDLEEYRKPVFPANRETNAGFTSYAGKDAPGLATSARGAAMREHPVVNQFTAEANQWLDDFAASLKSGPIGPK